MIDKNTIRQIIELVSDNNDSDTLISEVESLINNSLKFTTFDEYFIKICDLIKLKSKDKSTKIGAIIVGEDNQIISSGYNSFPRGINDDIPERQERPEKYYWFSHAETNAILNAARIGVSVKNCKMYTHGMPCMNCARMIVQSGINEIIISKKWCEDNYKY